MAVDRIAVGGARAARIVVDGRLRRFDHVLCTLLPPQAARLLSAGLSPQPLRPTTAAISASSALIVRVAR